MCWPFGKKKPPNPAPVAAPPVTGTASSPQVSPSKPLDAARPLPNAPGPEVELGAYTYCGWPLERAEFGKVTGTECPSLRPWDSSTATNRKLVLGTPHDERDPAITAQRLAWMKEYGLRWAIYQVQHPHANTTESLLPEARRGVPPLLMSHCADNHPEGSGVQFALSNWDVNAGKELNYWNELKALGWDAAKAENSWRIYVANAARYMRHPDYLTMPDGRLVLFHGGAENLAFYETMFGLKPERIVEVWREECRKATGKELYLMSVNSSTQHPEIEDVNERVFLKRWGFDGFAHYLLHGKGGWDDAMATYKYWRERDLRAAKVADLKYWPSATTGFDSRGWYEHPDVYIPTGAQLLAHLKDTMRFAADNYPVTEPKVPIYAMGEYYEGGIADPMEPGQLHDGYEVMETIRAAVSG